MHGTLVVQPHDTSYYNTGTFHPCRTLEGLMLCTETGSDTGHQSDKGPVAVAAKRKKVWSPNVSSYCQTVLYTPAKHSRSSCTVYRDRIVHRRSVRQRTRGHGSTTEAGTMFSLCLLLLSDKCVLLLQSIRSSCTLYGDRIVHRRSVRQRTRGRGSTTEAGTMFSLCLLLLSDSAIYSCRAF